MSVATGNHVESTQYMSIRYIERLVLVDIDVSVVIVGDSYDNKLAEITNGLYSAEVIHHQGTLQALGPAIADGLL